MEGSKRNYVDTARSILVGRVSLFRHQTRSLRHLEAPFDPIDSYLTRRELFYIRSNFPTPALDRASYQLRVDGRRFETSVYAELR